MNRSLAHYPFVSRETTELLWEFAARVRKWNAAVNLVSTASLEVLEDRHIADSLQLASLCPGHVDRWVDLGSGGGFPGLVIAIQARESGWPKRVTLIESDVRKAVFLRETARELSLPVDVLNVRAETLPNLKANVLSARAFSSLTALCRFAHGLLDENGVAIFPKGATYASEIADAKKIWNFDIDIHPSRTDSEARVLVLRNVRHVK